MTTSLTAQDVRALRRTHGRRRALIISLLVLVVVALFLCSLSWGERSFDLEQLWRIVLGERVEGAFVVRQLRLPRAIVAVLVGCCFGLAGVSFQTLLRNPLASPDIIGITSGASVAAVFGITVLGMGGSALSALAVVAALGTAVLIYLLAVQRSTVGTRLILIGIGVGAFLDAVVSWMLLRTSQWDIPAAMRWLTGSLNSAFWSSVPPLLIGMIILVPVLGVIARHLRVLELGDDTATAVGASAARSRIALIVVAVGLAAIATATTGPIAFVALLSGPIAIRLVRSRSLLLPAALVGAVIVLGADLVARQLMPVNYPVGVVTGMIGAPFLIALLVRVNRQGVSL